jgi:ketosteroid isomerase-like protein
MSGMMEYFAEDIVCLTRGRWRAVTFPQRMIGKAAVKEAYRLLNIEYENLGSAIHELLIDGDRVALHRTTSVRHRGTSQVFTFDVMTFARFREGLVVEFAEYPDLSAAAVFEDSRM